MRIKVLKKHIKAGRKGSCSTCPVALALADATGYKTISAGFWSLVLGRGKQKCDTPRKVERFMVRFDNDKVVEPFEFNVPFEARS